MNTTDRILGEADEVSFSQQFKDLLELMSVVGSLSGDWSSREVHTVTHNNKLLNSLAREANNYDKKYESGLVERSILYHIGRVRAGRRVNDDFWTDVANDLTLLTIEAIHNGTMEAYDRVGMILIGRSLEGIPMKEQTPENLPIIQAIADAMDLDVNHIYDLMALYQL